MNNTLKAVCLTHIGKRPNHEDNFLFGNKFLSKEIQEQMVSQNLVYLTSDLNNRIQLYAISDGMGGHNAGEVASRICVEQLALLENRVQNCGSIAAIIDLVQKTITNINEEVYKLSQDYKQLRDMGATLILLVVFDSTYIFFNLGDSRAYFYSDGKFQQITKDNTEGQRMLDLGLLSKEELSTFKARKNLIRYIGFNNHGQPVDADVYKFRFPPGNIILCSDGVSDAISTNDLRVLLSSNKTLLEQGKEIVQIATSKDYADNSTLMIIPVR